MECASDSVGWPLNYFNTFLNRNVIRYNLGIFVFRQKNENGLRFGRRKTIFLIADISQTKITPSTVKNL